MTNIFEYWERKPTNTEILVSLLIEQGLEITKPCEFSDVYRVQQKITGVERRSALCYWGRFGSCSDIKVSYRKHNFFGIDLLAPVKDLIEHGISLEANSYELYLWVYPKEVTDNESNAE